MVQGIDSTQETSIARTFTKLVKNGDDKNDEVSKTLLLIYTPVTSGLLFLSTSIGLADTNDKIAFLILVTSSILIVLVIIVEKLGHYSSLTLSVIYLLSMSEKQANTQMDPYMAKNGRINLYRA